MSTSPQPYVVVWELHGKDTKAGSAGRLQWMRTLMPQNVFSSSALPAPDSPPLPPPPPPPTQEMVPTVSASAAAAPRTPRAQRKTSTPLPAASPRPPLPPIPASRSSRSTSAQGTSFLSPSQSATAIGGASTDTNARLSLPQPTPLPTPPQDRKFDELSLKSPRVSPSSPNEKAPSQSSSDLRDKERANHHRHETEVVTQGDGVVQETSATTSIGVNIGSDSGAVGGIDDTHVDKTQRADDLGVDHDDNGSADSRRNSVASGESEYKDTNAISPNDRRGGDDEEIAIVHNSSMENRQSEFRDDVYGKVQTESHDSTPSSSATSSSISASTPSPYSSNRLTTQYPTRPEGRSRSRSNSGASGLPTPGPAVLEMSFTIWKTLIEPTLRSLCSPLNLSNYKPKNSDAQNNVFLSQVKSVHLDFLLASDPRALTSRHWSKWFQNPYFHLIIVQADTMDEYRNNVRPILRDLVKRLQDKDYEYQIVYIAGDSSLLRKLSLSSAYDRLKSDFSDRKDRVMKLIADGRSPGKREDSFVELEGRIKEGVVLEFVRRIGRYEQEIKKFQTNRQLPGWHYCPYFIVKEGLAFVLEQFGLYINTLSIYKELKSFIENENVVFDKFIDPADRSITKILDISTKPYRKMIYENRISGFDFSNYLFARQFAVTLTTTPAQLYFQLGALDDAARFAREHVTKMVMRMEEQLLHPHHQEEQQPQQKVHENDEFSDLEYISNHAYIHFWGFCAAICVVEACQKRAFDTDSDTLVVLCKILGELYSFAQHRLQVLCKIFNLQSQWESFRISGNRVKDVVPKSGHDPIRFHPSSKQPSMSRELLARLQKLRERRREKGLQEDNSIGIPFFASDFDVAIRVQKIMRSQEGFDKLYLELLSAASRAYYNGGRVRFFHMINGDIASIRFRQKRFSEAQHLLKGQLVHYMEDGWDVLATDVRIRLAECQRMMQDRGAYCLSCISLLLSGGLSELQAAYFKLELLDHCSVDKDFTISPITAGEIDFDQMRIVFQQPKYEITEVEVGEDMEMVFDVHSPDLCTDIEFDEVTLHFAPPLLASLSSIGSEADVAENDSSSSSSSSGGGDGSIVISCGQFSIKPGAARRIRVSHRMMKTGEFALEKIVFRIAEMEFIVEYDALLTEPQSQTCLESITDTLAQYEDKAIQLITRVVPSAPSLTIETLHDDCFFFDKLHSVSVTIDSLKDEVLPGARLEIHADNDCVQMGHQANQENISLLVTGGVNENEDKPISSTLVNGQMNLPACARNGKIEFQLPIRAICTASGASTSGNVVVVSLSFVLTYTKDTGETFTVRSACNLRFYKPFIYFFYATHLANGATLLQIVLECTTPMPLAIASYQMRIPDQHSQQLSILADDNHNAFEADGVCVLRNEESVSLVFRVEEQDGGEQQQEQTDGGSQREYKCHLDLQYWPLVSDQPDDKSMDVLSYTIDVDWVSAPPVLFEVDCSFCSALQKEHYLRIGEPVTMCITVRQMQQWESAGSEMWLDISLDAGCWIMSGAKRRLFKLQGPGSDPQTFQCTVIPLVCGYVALPSIKIITSIDEDNLLPGQVKCTFHEVNQHHGATGDRIVVMPSRAANACPMTPIAENMQQANIVHRQSLLQNFQQQRYDVKTRITQSRAHGGGGGGGSIKRAAEHFRTRSLTTLPNDATENDALSSGSTFSYRLNNSSTIKSSSITPMRRGAPSMQKRLRQRILRRRQHSGHSPSSSGDFGAASFQLDLTEYDDELATFHDAVDDDDDEISYVDFESVALNTSSAGESLLMTEPSSPESEWRTSSIVRKGGSSLRNIPRLSVTTPRKKR